ncbi:hypothetical protein Tco_0941997 [Tanacetum coccineum]|uniref:Uncharacterized protein n=1 Tax=Tanacetum coccineum TaxID=301880 RepID=A0ABQ5DSH6_9ASTR
MTNILQDLVLSWFSFKILFTRSTIMKRRLPSSQINDVNYVRERSHLCDFKHELRTEILLDRADSANHIEYLMLKASHLKHVKRGQDTKIPQSSGPYVKVGDEGVHKELGDRMERAATTASSLEAEVHTLGSGEDNMKLMELMAHCTKLSALFWQTASTSILEDGEVEITTTIDGQLNTITEASLRRHLKLEDADGISSLSNSKIFEQLALIGVPTPPHDLPLLGGHTPGSDEGSMTLIELMVLYLEDPSKHGRKITEIVQNPSISLVQDEGTSWITANISVSTASATPEVSTAAENLVYQKECRKEKR